MHQVRHGIEDAGPLRGIDRRLLACVHKKIRALLPIQVSSWRSLQSGPAERDFQIIASTGKGKTLSYALPTLNTLAKFANKERKVLVLVPSTELAKQVATEFHPFAEAIFAKVATYNTALQRKRRTTAILSRKRRAQLVTERAEVKLRGRHVQCDILIVTPSQVQNLSRVLSHTILNTCIIDEADKLTRQLHQGWLAHVNSIAASMKQTLRTHVGERRFKVKRTILVSATLQSDGSDAYRVNTHAMKNVFESHFCELHLPLGLRELCVLTAPKQKVGTLRKILKLFEGESIIVITSSVITCSYVWEQMKKLNRATRLVKYSGCMSKMEQKSSLEAFRSGNSRVMIASDAAARGLDIPSVGLVVLYDAPLHVETYIHRVGRTARAGATGIAITFCCNSERQQFESLSSSIRRHTAVAYHDAQDFLDEAISEELRTAESDPTKTR